MNDQEGLKKKKRKTNIEYFSTLSDLDVVQKCFAYFIFNIFSSSCISAMSLLLLYEN